MMKSWRLILSVFLVNLILTNGEKQIQQVVAELRNQTSETRQEQVDEIGKILKNVEAVMDPTVDPCGNFYQFVCGRFRKRSISAAKSTEEQIKKRLISKYEQEGPLESENKLSLIKHSRNLYKSCKNSKNVESLDDFILRDLEAIGGWPALKGNSWNKSAFDWKRSVFKVGSQTNWKNQLFNINLHKSNDFIYLDFRPTISLTNRAFRLAGRLSGNNSTVTKELEKVDEFSKKFSDLYSASRYRFSPVQFTLQDLIDKYPYYPWLEHFRYLLPNIQLNETLGMDHRDAIDNLHSLLNNTDQRMLANLVAWNRVSDLEDAFVFNHRLPIFPDSENCFDLVSNVFPMAPVVLYLHEFGYTKKINETKQFARAMSNRIRQQFIEMLKNADWISHKTYLLEKLEKLDYQFGYALDLFEDNLLNKYYDQLQYNQTNFYEIILSAWEVARLTQLDEQLIAHREQLTEFLPRLNTPRYASFNQKSVSISMDWPLFERQFLDINNPMWMNFASFGATIAREFGQSLDPFYIPEEVKGVNGPWSPNSTEYIEYDKKLLCLNEQYKDIANISSDSRKIYTLDQETSVDEVADNLGFQTAYSAYNNSPVKGISKTLHQKEYSPDQLFWIYATNRFCEIEQPLTDVTRSFTISARRKIDFGILHQQLLKISNELKVLGSISNIDGFARDFNCPANSPMNRQQKCHLF